MVHEDEAKVLAMQAIAARVKQALDERHLDVLQGADMVHAVEVCHVCGPFDHALPRHTAFRTFDLNGDGCLSRAELLDMFTSLDTGVSPAQLQMVIRASDSNTDGYMNYRVSAVFRYPSFACIVVCDGFVLTMAVLCVLHRVSHRSL